MDLGVEPRRRLAGILISFWQLLHPYLALSCLDSVLLLDQAGLGQDSEAGSAQTSFTLNKLSAHVIPPSLPPSPAAFGE